ncbi:MULTISPECIES: YciI family protein [Roseobacteraceae]|jgi:uncharacterized protein YciI|uniref:YciI-like protein n=1 Tax=Pseudosulfitobacter pseudonitzschiae TaxID=1402135 RepID=A0A221K550_9RHOB|nr:MULTISPECIES: YciI family protein [Roseobacteraceae]ASM74003.1 YciI-like protein [Pseudosulfitobacter pseudonitzschiae]
MLIALIATDREGALDVRKANRDNHLAYIEKTGVVAQAGPLLDGSGQMAGSLVILSVDSMADAQLWADNDPYALAGLFADVKLIEWKKVIG